MITSFPRALKDELIQTLQTYFRDELDTDLGNFEAEFLLDHLSEQLGPHYYNQAIRDVQVHLSGHLDMLNERIDELSKPLPKNG
jgi:uncharacterized protein (DUF2164 family)